MFHSKHSNSDLVLFDVRLRSSYKDVILLQGSEVECPSTPILGSVVCSLASLLAVKKVSLKLVGIFKLEFFEVIQDPASNLQHSIPVKEEKVVFECFWDNLLLNPRGCLTVIDGNPVESSVQSSEQSTSTSRADDSATEDQGLFRIPKTKSMSSLHLGKKSKNFIRSSNSSSNFITLSDSSNVLGTPFHELGKLKDESLESKNFVLPQGNYDLPFNIVVPGSISETVEGLLGGSILYKFQATIHKAPSPYQANLKFFQTSSHNSTRITKNKYIRVFRALSPETLLIPQGLSISNMWPSKVQYVVDVPTKHVAIGLRCTIKLRLIPLIKRLKLSKISVSLIEYYAYKGRQNAIYDDSRRVASKSIDPDMQDDVYNVNVSEENIEDEINGINRDSNLVNSNDNDTLIDIGQNNWLVTTHLAIPAHLKDVTQDCDLQNDLIKVRHKLKLKVSLLNPDGHISELRANLPVILFINPNVPIYGRHVAMDDSGKTHFRLLEEPIFKAGGASITGSTVDLSALTELDPSDSLLNPSDNIDMGIPPVQESSGINQTNSQLILNQLAPPHYESHVYDRLYDPNARPDTTTDSSQVANDNTSSQASAGSCSTGSARSSNDGTENQQPQQLSPRRLGAKIGSPLTNSAASFSAGTNNAVDNLRRQAGPSNRLTSSHSGSPRRGGPIEPPLSPMNKLSLDELSKVPSYNQAIEEYVPNGLFNVELAPLYESARRENVSHTRSHSSSNNQASPSRNDT